MSDYITTFPKHWQFDVGKSIDIAVRAFSRNNQHILSAIKSIIISVIRTIHNGLVFLPWFVLIGIIVFLGIKASRKVYIGLLYGAMLMFIGFCGLWSHTLETLSVVIAAVIIALIIGFPLGVAITLKDGLAAVVHPVLDLMQTLPSFVYLVPAVILFDVGQTPALIATATYAVVPMVRMTSHGIRYVDKEMIEAAKAFGSTNMQTLCKIQIPQAIPTIMTGVNQTIMMAMSMVVTCALIGAKGLGMEILLATNRTEVGKALLPGISIVFIAIIFDRLTQGAIRRMEVEE